MDMRTTRISKGGAEYPLSFTASAEIAAFYDLPSYHALGQADSGRTDIQTGAEKMLQCFCGRGSGLSLVLGMGQLDVGLILSPEQVLIDHEILGVVDRFYQGITVDRDHLAFDAITRASKGAPYVMDESTMMFLRTEEHHYPRAFDRTGSRRPEDGMVAKAHELVRSTVAAHQPKVNPSKAEDIQRYARKKEKELAGGP
jgi:trimethylamine--corrinoid protein Co-methyltransferase